MKIILLTFVLALAMGCMESASAPTATPIPFKPRQLDVVIDPIEAATFLLNPSPLGKGGYAKGMVVTIDVLPKQGWEVDSWVGPVYNINVTTAQIEMDSSQSVAVRLISTALPTPTPTLVPTSTPTLEPTVTPRPTPTRRPTWTPTPKATDLPVFSFSTFEKGRGYYNSGLYQLAIEEFTLAIAINPGGHYYSWRGNSFHQDGQYQRAISDYNEAIRLEPHFSRNYANRGQSYKNLGQYQRSIKDFDKAIAIKSDYAFAYYYRGKAYRAIGQYGQENSDKAKACRLHKDWCFKPN